MDETLKEHLKKYASRGDYGDLMTVDDVMEALNSYKHTDYPPEFPEAFTAAAAANFDKEGYDKTLEALGLRTKTLL